MLFLLHWLGGGAQTWDQVSEVLGSRGVQAIAIDLPGFGDAITTGGFNKAAMADEVVATLQALRRESAAAAGEPWCLAGHSMGGAVAMIVARRALDGEAGLENLRGLALVSPSTPGPEPMPEHKRSAMLASLGASTGDATKDRKHAEAFLDENTGKLALPEDVRAQAVEGVLHMNRTALRLWLEQGSKEDWSARIGTLALPALIVAGTEDAALGPDAQRERTLPHLPKAELATLEGAGHLAPLERPQEVAEYLTQFLAGCGLTLATTEAQPGPVVADAMRSERTSPQTREVMTQRLRGAQDWNHKPKAFTAAEQRSVRGLAAAVVPDAGFDLAACLDRELSESPGDGWRFAALPPDADAWRQGLRSLDLAADRLHNVSFLALHPGQQHALLQQAAAGKLGPGLLGTLHLGQAAQAFTAEQMKSWFEDVRGELTRLYIADPRTMDRIGFTGFADDLGFTQIQLGQQEEFER